MRSQQCQKATAELQERTALNAKREEGAGTAERGEGGGHAALLCRINSFAALTDMRGNKTNERASQIVATFPRAPPPAPVAFLHP